MLIENHGFFFFCFLFYALTEYIFAKNNKKKKRKEKKERKMLFFFFLKIGSSLIRTLRSQANGMMRMDSVCAVSQSVLEN